MDDSSILLLLVDTLSVLARTIGKDVFSPLAAECLQLGLNLTDTIDDPDLRRCTYVAYFIVFFFSGFADIVDLVHLYYFIGKSS